jgi:hypothetical protein
MQRTPSEVQRIMDAKYKIACDRDLLRHLLWHLRAEIARIETANKQRRKADSFLREKKTRYRFIAGSIVQSIEAANALLKPASFFDTSCIFHFLETRIRTVQDSAGIFSHKFIRIGEKIREMTDNIKHPQATYHQLKSFRTKSSLFLGRGSKIIQSFFYFISKLQFFLRSTLLLR